MSGFAKSNGRENRPDANPQPRNGNHGSRTADEIVVNQGLSTRQLLQPMSIILSLHPNVFLNARGPLAVRNRGRTPEIPWRPKQNRSSNTRFVKISQQDQTNSCVHSLLQ
jgi:hypothetical protein